MNRRMIALLLVAALAMSLCGASVVAAGSSPADSSQTQDQADPSQDERQGDASQEEAPAPDSQEEQPEGGDGLDAEAPVEEEPEPEPDLWELLEDADLTPDPVGSISFVNLGSRLRENNLNLLALEETIATIEVIDYDKMEDEIRKQLNQIADAQWAMVSAGSSIPGYTPTIGEQLALSMSSSVASQSLDQAYDSLRDVFDDIRDGKLQKDNADLVRQLRSAQDQIVMAGESLYIALIEMENNLATAQRSAVTLERTIQEMELRYQLGQISALTLQEVKGNKTTLDSGMQTLNMNIENYKTQLELLIGAEMTGAIQLGALPGVSEQRLAEMDLEADLAAYKEASYDLYDAKKTLEDAEQDFKDARKKYGYDSKKYQYAQAQHTWQSAQYTYNATIQNAEMKFRTLYLQVKDYQQVLGAAQTALACQQDSYAAMQLKYEQGTISKNKLLDAQDEVSAAQDKVASAAVDLFSAYHNYRWAVDYGILN